jgi:hypothetical protein
VTAWPIDPNGHALFAWRETPKGARVLSMPHQGPLQHWHLLSGYRRLFENMFDYLTEPKPVTPAVPALGTASRGLLTAALVGASGQLLRKKRAPEASEQSPGDPATGDARQGNEAESAET